MQPFKGPKRLRLSISARAKTPKLSLFASGRISAD
jgi:hypothetical protein